MDLPERYHNRKEIFRVILKKDGENKQENFHLVPQLAAFPCKNNEIFPKSYPFSTNFLQYFENDLDLNYKNDYKPNSVLNNFQKIEGSCFH